MTGSGTAAREERRRPTAASHGGEPAGVWRRLSAMRLPEVSRRERAIALAAVLVLAFGLRLALAQRSTLWADEIFSLAIATGHSLEHPAGAADPTLGDFVEAQGPLPRESYLGYVRHDDPPAGPGRVLRAAFLSDTNPPLYYLLLEAWTRLVGTSDLALRSFSILCALACVPLLWRLGRALGGRRTARVALVVFGFAPPALYYATEGRMYALVWLLALGLAWATLRWAHEGSRPGIVAVWVVSGAAGLLTHYFFAFVWLACAGALLLEPGRSRRLHVGAAAAATALAVLPWYLRVPESLGLWRVTGRWLMGNLTWIDALLSPLLLAWSSLSGRGSWGGRAWADFAGAFLVLLLVLAMLRRSLHPLFAGRRKLLWIWLGAVCLGPVAFDLMRHTLTAQISRYALAGLPAAVLLLSLAAARLPRKGRVLFLSLLVLTWVPNLWAIVATTVRNNEPYRPLARRLAMWTGPEDVVVVHAIPSGLIALARYSDTTAPFAAWVQQLGLRTVPKDLLELSAGRRRVAVVRVHEVATPAPEEAWLLEHARILTQREWPTRDRWNRNRLLVVEAPRQTGAPTPPPSRDQAPAAAAGREPADRGSESWR